MGYPRDRDLYSRDPARRRLQLANEQAARDRAEAEKLPRTWNLCAQNPQAWALCKKLASGRLLGAVARVTRSSNGDWLWEVFDPRAHGLREPSRNEAMIAAERELERIEKIDTES